MANKITEFTEDVEVIQKLGDYPNTDDSMSSDELKAQFDKAPIAIKEFLNKTVVPAVKELEDNVAKVDKTLTQEGYFADAKATGEAIAKAKDEAVQQMSTAAKNATDAAVAAAEDARNASDAAENAAASAQQAKQVAGEMQGVVDDAKEATEKVPYLAEGVSQNYYLKKPGWKRILVNTRIQNGFVALSLSRNHVIPGDAGRGRTFQNLGLMFTGFVDYPGREWNAPDSNLFHRTGKDKPVLYQMYNNYFGEEIGVYPERRALITRVRIGYPKPTAENAAKLSQNPINCYLDVYCDFEDTGDEEPFVQFMVNYMGKTYNHDVVILTEDTEAEDIGIHGEKLEFHYFSPNAGYAQDIPNASRVNTLEAETVAARNVVVLEEKTAALNSDAVLSSRITEIQIPEGLPAGTMYLHARRKYNLLSNPLIGKSGTRCGITWSCGTDGGFTLDGTATSTGIIPLMNTTAADLADALLLNILLPPGSYQVYGLQVRYTKYAADGTVTETGKYVTSTTIPATLTNTDGYTLLTRASVLIVQGTVYDPKKKLFPYICKKDGREADIDVSGNVPTINGTAITDPAQWYSEPPTAFTVPDLAGTVLLDFAGNTAWADGEDVTAKIPGNVFNYMSMVKNRYADAVNRYDSLALWVTGSEGLPPQGTVRWETEMDLDGRKVDIESPYSTAFAPYGLYGCMEDGTVQRFYTTMKAEALRIPRYTATGNLRTNTPSLGTDAANKNYVDAEVATRADKALTGVLPIYYAAMSVNLNTVTKNGYQFAINATNSPFPHCAVHTYRLQGGSFTPSNASDILIQEATEWNSGSKAIRTSPNNGASWNPWEYDNPPMVAGVTYRTTERYLEKPVYTTLINFGYAYSSATAKIPAHSQIVRWAATGTDAANEDVVVQAPNDRLEFQVYVHAGDETVEVFGNENEGVSNIKIQLWYCVD